MTVLPYYIFGVEQAGRARPSFEFSLLFWARPGRVGGRGDQAGKPRGSVCNPYLCVREGGEGGRMQLPHQPCPLLCSAGYSQGIVQPSYDPNGVAMLCSVGSRGSSGVARCERMLAKSPD